MMNFYHSKMYSNLKIFHPILTKFIFAGSFKLPTRFLQCENHAKSAYHFTQLNKKIIVLDGKDSKDFMQGLITNDIRHLWENHSTSVTRSCIYTFMLTSTGRTIADLFLYKFSNQDEQILIEVDANIASQISQLLKRYKIRRKVSIQANTDWKSYVIYPENVDNLKIQGETTQAIVSSDPRLSRFGIKIVTQKELNFENLFSLLEEIKSSAHIKNVVASKLVHYRLFRYKLGVGEGPLDFPPESTFPFEANADILNAVSFQKGCYVGQELTARTYHTGVIRKRFLPIEIMPEDDNQPLEALPMQNVVDQDGKTMGRFRGNLGLYGIAALKFKEIFDSDHSGETKQLRLSLSGHPIRTWKPFWWPDML